jgi:hypothetical protein
VWVAGVQVDDGGAGFGGGQCFVPDLLGGDGQVGDIEGVDGACDCAGDDDFLGLGHGVCSFDVGCAFGVICCLAVCCFVCFVLFFG